MKIGAVALAASVAAGCATLTYSSPGALDGVAELQAALLKIAESRNCDLADVSYFDGDASYAGPSYGGAVGTCFGSSHMSVSAILVPRKVANKEEK